MSKDTRLDEILYGHIDKRTQKVVDKADFSDLEKFYGKEFSLGEKYDMVDRFNRFLEIVLEDYSKTHGVDAYIENGKEK